jgi:DNA gyrase subunit A
LYATYVKKIFPNSKFTKNAEIVGEVIGKYSPHGDTSTYGALVNLAQPWNTKYPLIDFHGRQ